MIQILSTRSTVLAVVGALSLACRGGSPAGGKAPGSSAGAFSPPPQSVHVEPDEVVAEGRWFPIEAGPEAAALANAVRLVCRRAERSCKEQLTRPSNYPGADPVQDVFRYRVEEWTKWGKPAGRLVASRREGTAEVAIRVSLNGLAAEKAILDKGTEIRWRLE